MSAAGEILTLRVDAIRVPEGRFRVLKTEQAAAIGASIAAEGQFDAIAVTRLPGQADYVLVDGWHRLEGSRFCGLETIEARLIEPGKSTRVKREVLSGLVRATVDVFDRAAAIDALAKMAREEAGQPAVGDLRRRDHSEIRGFKAIQDDADAAFPMMGNMLRWDLQVAEQLGLGKSTVRRMAVIHERIPDVMKGRLRACGEAEKLVPLLAFAELDRAAMDFVLMQMERHAMDLAGALAHVAGPRPVSPVEKAQNAVFRKAGSWSPRERASFFEQWSAAYHPDGRARAQSKTAREG